MIEMAKITAPVEGFTGIVGGVEFEAGVAVTDNHAVIEYCRGAGYSVEDEAKGEAQSAKKAAAKPSSK